MKKVLVLLVFNFVFADVFENNCLKCHNTKELKIFMSKYTLLYSSEKNVKQAIYNFLSSPTSNRSVMPYEYIKKYGFKEASKLDSKDLKKAIDIYWEKYNLRNFIR